MEGYRSFTDAHNRYEYVPKKNKKDNDDDNRFTKVAGQPAEVHIVKIRELIEMILCLEAWCSYGPFWGPRNQDKLEPQYKERIGHVVETLEKQLPRSAGNGWNLQKVHEALHIPHFISLYGHPMNYDAGQGEHALKGTAKKPARQSQKRSQKEFLKQVAARVEDRIIKEHALSMYEEAEGTSGATSGTPKLEKNRLQHRSWHLQCSFLSNGSSEPRIKPYRMQNNLSKKGMQQTITQWVKNQIELHLGSLEHNKPEYHRYSFLVQGYSEMCRYDENNKKHLFRAHENYRGNGPVSYTHLTLPTIA